MEDTKMRTDKPRTLVLWWNHRSLLERILFLVATVSFVLCIITVISLILLSFHQMNRTGLKQINSENSHRKHSICLTPGCVKAAGDIINYINESVEPCEDFYAFACGSWLENAVISEDQSEVSAYLTLNNELHRRLLGIIENIEPNPPSYIQNVKNAFSACMNTTEIERLGSAPLEHVIEKLRGWPVVEGKRWESFYFDWSFYSTHQIRQLGLEHDIFIRLSVSPDIKNNTRHIIQLDQPRLGIDYAYSLRGLEDPAVSAYYKLMVDSAVLLGAEPDVAKEEMLETLNFERELANISMRREEMRNISNNYNKMTLRDLSRLVPEIEWGEYLEALLGPKIPPNEEILVSFQNYMQDLGKLLRYGFFDLKNEKKIVRVIANYMIWRIVLKSMPYLSKKWRDLYQDYNAALTGKVREPDRWLQCLNTFTWKLSKVIGSMYAKNYLNPTLRDQVSNIAQFVYRAFLKNLDNVKWMDDDTKKKAKQKAENMIMNIGYPDELLDHNQLSAIYSDLTLNEMNHFDNVLKLNKWQTDNHYSKLRKPRTRGDWKNLYGIAVVNAFYHPQENALEIPGGILQEFFYSAQKPNYLNFGAIGSVIDHEIIHGFDDEGRQFDDIGNNVNWWEDETDINFKQRAQCMIDQYDNYTHPEVQMAVNGINTLGENIADNAAVKEAFWAYKQWVSENKEEPMLPGLKYTPNQLFWINAVTVECTKQRPEDLRYQIMLDSHSPPYNRVIGSLSNSEDFSKEFNCPVGSPMNPKKKCTVW